MLNCFEQIDNYIIEINSNEILTDEILIKIGAKNPSEELKKEISNHFRAKIRVVPKIEFHNIDELNKIIFPPQSRKPIRFIDKREK